MARAAAARAVQLDPTSVEARHYLAAALAGLGEYDAADRAFHEALALAPDDLDLLLDAAELLVERFAHDREALAEAVELAGRGADLARRRRGRERKLAAEFALLEARAFLGLGRPRAALWRLDDAARTLSDDLDVALARGTALFELLRLDEAQEVFEEVLTRSPEEAYAWWYLGLIAERRAAFGTGGAVADATALFERARRLDPEGFPGPLTLSEGAFDAVVESALAALPEKVRRYLENVAVTVEPLPSDEDLAGDPPLSPTILGLFRGTPITERSVEDPWSHFPASIVLYQRNLERACRTREALVEEIEITLLHEVGHFLGLSEEEVAALGLE